MKKFKSKISMSLPLFLGIVFCGIASCAVISFIFITYSNRHAYDNSKKSISSFVDSLGHEINQTSFWTESVDSVNSELYSIANGHNGRVIVADAGLCVVFDSYHTKQGKILLVSEIISALQGNEYFDVNEEEGIATYILPVSSGSENSYSGVFYIRYSVHDELTRHRIIRRYTAMIAVSLSIIIVAFGIALTTIFVQPLHRISRELAEISDISPDARLDVRNNRQVSEISDTMNKILDRSREMEENRQNFVSDVSHELKTPMTSMKILSDALLMSGADLPDTVREFLTDINSEIDRENHIISDLLALARMDRKTDTVKYERTHINEVLDIILNRIRPMAEAKQIEVVCEIYRDVYADVDAPKLMMAISNLCVNAITYNHEGGSVYVTLNANMNYFYITVQDTGCGIAESEISHIFERFYRVDKDRSRETGGTGLGLAITKEIVNAHGGQIKVYSKLNEGTTFSVRIPIYKPLRKEGLA